MSQESVGLEVEASKLTVLVCVAVLFDGGDAEFAIFHSLIQ